MAKNAPGYPDFTPGSPYQESGTLTPPSKGSSGNKGEVASTATQNTPPVEPGIGLLDFLGVTRDQFHAMTPQQIEDLGAQKASAAAKAKQVSTQNQPVFSKQNLQDYEQSYIMPLIQSFYGKGGIMSNEIGALQKSIGVIGQGGGNSAITNMFQGQLAGLLPLEQQFGKDTIIANQIKPFLDIINNQIGGQASLGAKYAAQGAGIQNFLQYAASDPTMANYLSAIGLGGGAQTGVQGLLAGLGVQSPTSTPTPVSGAGVTTQVPGATAGSAG